MSSDRSYKFARGRNSGFRRPRPKADSLGQLMEEVLCAPKPIARVAVASARTAVSPAMSLSVSPASSREKQTTETQGSQQSNKSGSKSETTKPNCYACKYRRGLAGDAHSQCAHPRITDVDRAITPLLLMAGKTSPVQKRLNVHGHEHGIRKGWFLWPINFDPVWLVSCDGFTPKDIGE